MNTGLLILRLFVGLALGAHGAQKLFGWWGGSGVRRASAHMTHMRLRPASLWVAGAIGTEIGGGLLLAAGLLSPLGSVGVGAAMLMAIVSSTGARDSSRQGGGLEIATALPDPGRRARHHRPRFLLARFALRDHAPGAGDRIVAAALAVGGVAVAMAGRSPAVEQPAAQLAA